MKTLVIPSLETVHFVDLIVYTPGHSVQSGEGATVAVVFVFNE